MSTLRHALVSLIKTPGFTLVALITLALGIGVNTSMYTLVDVLLFRSAPYPEPDRMLLIQALNAQGQPDGYGFPEVEELRVQVANGEHAAFESVTTLAGWNNAWAEPGQPAERLRAVDASAEFFSTFRVQPMLGRAFTADEETPGRNQVAILSHSFWQSRLGGDPNVIGRTLRLNAEQVTIIGVMPASFRYPLFFGPVDLWRPITLPQHIVQDRTNRLFFAIGRLAPGMTVEQATAQAQPVFARWAQDYPQHSAGRTVRPEPLHKVVMDSTGRFMMWLLCGVGIVVLLIACFNLANLQLARAAARTRDLAIRSALGASRARLILHQLTESMLLALAGGGLGVLVGIWMNALLESQIQIGGTEHLTLNLDVPILLLTLLAAVFSGLVFGLVPAWMASRGDVVSTLKQQTRGSSSSRSTHRFRHSLIVAQVASALALLATAGVMLRGFNALLHANNGWDTDRVLAANIHLPEQSTYNSEDKRRLAIEKLARRLKQIPQAESTGIASTAPLFGYSKSVPIQVDGQTSDDPAKQPVGGYTLVASDYFQTMGIPLLEGRLFPEELNASSPPVVIINETMARHFWPGQSALGKRIGDRQDNVLVWREVIGVVRDIGFAVQLSNPDTLFQVYKPMVHEPWGYMFLLVRGPSPATFKNEVRRAVADIDPDVAVQELYTIPEAIDRYSHNIVLVNQTIGAFALLGVLLASVGLYGVISNLVAQRTGEFGIRLALGARPRDVLTLVLRGGMTLTAIGLGLGAVVAYALNLVLQGFMPRMAASDPLTIALVAVLLFSVAVFACWLPAQRATRINPLDALRAE
ncbi:ABC transporter permease [Opitutus terrae]|uniref:Permease n=1 Tax=Opitutus terrae (strain DSM 11246 / JCM 15787 / PB90-1) TaxID=452637 RepID=B1ZXW9_OPITP|nr:ABC transporter permease [Opitutus terrae]ACB75171.1 permease [Opitutus terrae PB90-1]